MTTNILTQKYVSEMKKKRIKWAENMDYYVTTNQI